MKQYVHVSRDLLYEALKTSNLQHSQLMTKNADHVLWDKNVTEFSQRDLHLPKKLTSEITGLVLFIHVMEAQKQL